jgi:trehalose/maltose hydrolase-like predicted phosphorylase
LWGKLLERSFPHTPFKNLKKDIKEQEPSERNGSCFSMGNGYVANRFILNSNKMLAQAHDSIILRVIRIKFLKGGVGPHVSNILNRE